MKYDPNVSRAGSDAKPEAVEPSDEIVAFFRALPAEARAEYEALAELDRRFGEDVDAERAAGAGSS
jgi:hypothetical protein